MRVNIGTEPRTEAERDAYRQQKLSRLAFYNAGGYSALEAGIIDDAASHALDEVVQVVNRIADTLPDELQVIAVIAACKMICATLDPPAVAEAIMTIDGHN